MREPICAIGIDLGTAKTGYAFAFKENRYEIYIKTPGGQEADKTNTALLLDKHENFLAFGNKALDKYFEDNHDETDLLFQRFKMELHKSQGHMHINTRALNGTTIPLLTVLSKTIEYVKEEALREINKSQIIPLNPDDIQWVLTVPAIWSDIAKGFMRRAALNAGLIQEESSERLELVLEPEAACIACEAETSSLQIGDTFMVLDCGGGTVDITMHRVAQKHPVLLLDEIRRPSGGPWGATFVDEKFEHFVMELMGDDRFRCFKPSSSWVDVMKKWEDVKRNFGLEQSSRDEKIVMNMSGVMEFVEDLSLKQLVDQYNRNHKIHLQVQGKCRLLLPSKLIETFFLPVISKSLNFVKELLEAHDVCFIFLVGGFAESKMLQQSVKDKFEGGGRRVIVPLRPGLTVVKGAVMMGLGASERFASRLAKRTYGVNCSVPYDALDPDHANRELCFFARAGHACVSVVNKFSEIVRVGTRIPLQHVHRGQEFVIVGDAWRAVTGCITIYASESADARWVTDTGVSKIGTVHYLAKGGDVLRVDLCFGASEIHAMAVNLTTGAIMPSKIAYDFPTAAPGGNASPAASRVGGPGGGSRGAGAGGGGAVGGPPHHATSTTAPWLAGCRMGPGDCGDRRGQDSVGESAASKRARVGERGGSGWAAPARRVEITDSDDD